jgi:DNA-binding CsgD family transcriptional regulator
MEVQVNNKVRVSDREITLVQLLANDYRIAEAAKKMKMEKRTLDAFTARVRNKFGCQSSHGLVAIFFRNGLIK